VAYHQCLIYAKLSSSWSTWTLPKTLLVIVIIIFAFAVAYLAVRKLGHLSHCCQSELLPRNSMSPLPGPNYSSTTFHGEYMPVLCHFGTLYCECYQSPTSLLLFPFTKAWSTHRFVEGQENPLYAYNFLDLFWTRVPIIVSVLHSVLEYQI
jgi:hypothetical protein